MSVSSSFKTRVLEKLRRLYGDDAPACLERIIELCRRHRSEKTAPPELWNERDVVLITYGDQVQERGRSALATLKTFLLENRLDELISTVHLLPFFPYSSDDGFSVIDYRQVDPALGDWNDIAELHASFQLMFDLVLNHCSQQSRWFQQYLASQPPYDRFFLELDPAVDLSDVTRPRNTAMLTPFETVRGRKHVWTTFSDDQIDLNFGNPDVLLEMFETLLDYVRRGARIVRLDAIAYLWKRIGTSCIHLPQTHIVVKLMRDLLDEAAPGTILLTETNVPHAENVSYFGDGDEAHMVYNFSLAPLLLDAFLTGEGGPLCAWLANLQPAGPGRTFFNFTASHDGIGVRPLEGLVRGERIDRLVEAICARGGHVSTRQNPDGSNSPYELNVTFFSALGAPIEGPETLSTQRHVRRFLASQAVMLAMRGIPGVYFHSLVGTANHTEGVRQTGRARTINRRKFQRGELGQYLANLANPQRQVFDGYRKLLATRVRQPAFHPDAAQSFVETGHPEIIAFLRTSLDGRQNILVLTNVAGTPVTVELPRCEGSRFKSDLLGGPAPTGHSLTLEPYQAAWLSS